MSGNLYIINHFIWGHVTISENGATSIAEHENSSNSFLQQQKIPPFVKDLFIGKFNRSLLSYAEILDDHSYLELEENVSKGKFCKSLRLTHF